MATPFRDSLPPRHFPWVTVALIAINCIVFLFVQPSAFQDQGTNSAADARRVADANEFTMRWALVPCEIVSGRPVVEHPRRCESSDVRPLPEHKAVYAPLLTSMFLHGSILHLAGNMLFLWVFGKNVEDRLGRVLYLLVYLVGGVAASMASVLVAMSSSVPHLGASGAIAAAMGAYLVLHPREQILAAIAVPPQVVYVPAAVVLVLFFATQFFTAADAGVAWQAHVGGMAAGALLALLLLPLPAVRARRRPPRQGPRATPPPVPVAF